PRYSTWRCPDKPGAPRPPPPCSQCARSTGDPHLATHDGLRFDLQAAGEFVAVAVDGLSRLQLRFEPLGASRQISVTTAVAMRVGTARVSLRPDVGLYVDGAPVVLPSSGTAGALALAGGGKIQRHGFDYLIDGPDGARVWVQVQERSLDVFFDAPAATRDRTRGLFGVFNQERGDDLTTRDGEVLPAPAFEPLHRRFAESWRVAAEDS